jgi:hypothetical protein
VVVSEVFPSLFSLLVFFFSFLPAVSLVACSERRHPLRGLGQGLLEPGPVEVLGR